MHSIRAATHKSSLTGGTSRARADLSMVRSSMHAINDCAMITVVGHDGVLLFANQNYCQAIGYDLQDLLGKQHEDLLDLQWSAHKVGELWASLREGRSWRGVLKNQRRSGDALWTETSVQIIGLGTGLPPRYLALHVDVTNQMMVTRQLQLSEQRLSHILAMTTEWYWEQDAHHRITLLSSGPERGSGLADAVVGKRRWDIAESGDATFWGEHKATLEARRSLKNLIYQARDKSTERGWRWVKESGEPFYDEAGQFAGYRGVSSDITDEYLGRERLWELSNTDKLTGLPNREHFNRTISARIPRLQPGRLELLIIDLDGFRALNAVEGFAAGDAVLCEVADAIRAAIGADDYLARISSDEFAVIRSCESAASPLQDLMHTILASIPTLAALIGSARLATQTISIGAAVYPDDAHEPEDLIKAAEVALQSARARGGNRYALFEEEDREEVTRQAQLVGEMHDALNAGQLMLYYQPIVDPARRSIVGVEALLRWRHPDLGVIGPARFHEAFKNVGLSVRLGDFVMRTALTQAGEWKRAGIKVGRVAVNVTSADFIAASFSERLLAEMGVHGLEPKDLCIEVTEGMFFDDSKDTTLSELRKLQCMGVETAFDDFGTGYASLTHLKLPIQRLKLDRSFIVNIEDDHVNRAIVGAVTAMAQRIGKHVTAEGVETEAQRQILLGLGCTTIQGFLYSQAIPGDEIAAFIERLSPVVQQVQTT